MQLIFVFLILKTVELASATSEDINSMEMELDWDQKTQSNIEELRKLINQKLTEYKIKKLVLFNASYNFIIFECDYKINFNFFLVILERNFFRKN